MSSENIEYMNSSEEEEMDEEGETMGKEKEGDTISASFALLGAIPKDKVLEKILAYRNKDNADPPVYEYFVKWKVIVAIFRELT